MAEAFAAGRHDVFLPRQFSNEDNSEAHYRTTGPEVWLQLAAAGVRPEAFVAGVGTGGTVMGVGRYLRSVIGSWRSPMGMPSSWHKSLLPSWD
jgi:cysteine synthase